jgi:dipeptidyl aminopeptidase/acylaminoacyl peptidase
VQLAGPPPVEFVRQEGEEGFPSPNGEAVAYVEREGGNAWLSLRAASGSRRLAQLADAASPPLIDGVKQDARALGGIPLVVEWSPDGSYLAFGGITGAPYTLHVVRAASSEDASFFVDGGYVGELRWSHDGDRLAISTYSLDRHDHSAYILDPDGGVPVRVIDGCHIIWSPDGSHILLHRDPQRAPGAWIVAIDGSEAFALTNDETAFPLAWVDGDGVAISARPTSPGSLSPP